MRDARRASLIACLLVAGLAQATATAADRLADIRTRGSLQCGIWPEVPGFASINDGHYAGFDVDICRAVAAAVLGDAAKVDFVALASISQFSARNDIDLVVRRLTWTPGRERASGIVFGPIIFYDGQGFLVPKRGGIRQVSQLAGKRVCVLNAERHPATLHDYFRDSGREVGVVLVDSDQEAEEALQSRQCLAYSADITWLAAARSRFKDGLARYDILAASISKEPLAPLLRAEDTDLLQLVRWTIYTLVTAEELGIDSRNVGAVAMRSPRARHFLQVHPGVDVARGPGDWVAPIIAGVGNYGELFERNLGSASTIRLDRGLNRLWNQGGLLYSPPLDR